MSCVWRWDSVLVPLWSEPTRAHKYKSFLTRAKKVGFYPTNQPTAATLCQLHDSRLFHSLTENSNHVLRPLLPPPKTLTYSTRTRTHNFHLPHKDDRNFINRMLYIDIY